MVLKLGDASWKAFETRLAYEWKINFAVWAALATFSVLLAKGDVRLSLPRLQRIFIEAGDKKNGASLGMGIALGGILVRANI